jgi:hypothetical protein
MKKASVLFITVFVGLLSSVFSLAPGNARAALVNISTRAFVGTGSSAEVAGFIVSGTGTGNKQVLIRGFGPTLSSFGISGALSNPTLDLYLDDDNNPATAMVLVISNNDWVTPLGPCPGTFVVACGTPTDIANTGLSADSYAPTNANRGLDAALLLTLRPGTYTARLSGVNNTTGVGLIGIDVLDADPLAQLINISTRATVGTGSNAEVAGLIIDGTSNKQFLLRGFGPTLTSFGISGALANPTLDLYWDDDNNPSTAAILVLTNNDWGTALGSCPPPVVSCGTPTDIQNTGMSANSYAPSSPGRALDSALLLTLPPGTYTARLSGVNNGTGVGLIGVDEVNLQYPLTVYVLGSGTLSSSPAGIAACSLTCTADFTHNSVVTLTPTPGGGFSFSSWGGACSGSGACAVTMSQARSVTAVFSSTSGNQRPTATSLTLNSLPTPQYTDVIYTRRYAFPLTGTDPEGGPLTFRITTWPTYQDASSPQSLAVGPVYQLVDFLNATWALWVSNTSSVVNPTTGNITGSPYFVYTGTICHVVQYPTDSFQYVAIDNQGNVSDPATVTLNFAFNTCNHPS